jgi:hypothetical protein
VSEPVPSDELVSKLREELAKRAFHNGGDQFGTIQYCDFCHYSRDWIAKHGHGEACILKVPS